MGTCIGVADYGFSQLNNGLINAVFLTKYILK